MLSPARFLGVLLGSAFLVCGLVAAFNVAVDPYGEFGSPFVLPDDTDRNSRAIKVALLRRVPPPEALILGNSRSMQLSPATVERLTGMRSFNASTAAGSSYDLVAFTRYALAQGWPVRTLIVGLDTFMLHPRGPMDELLYFPLVRYLPETEPPLRAQLQRVARTTSVNTAWLSGRRLHDVGRDRPRNVAFWPDGQIRYLPYDDMVARGEWTGPLPFAMESVRKQYLGSFNKDPEPTPEASRELERWLTETERAHLEVILFLPPINSRLVASIEKQTHYAGHLDAYRRYLQRLGQRFHFEFHDLSSVDRFAGDEQLFVDGVHMIGPNNDRALEAILGRRPATRSARVP